MSLELAIYTEPVNIMMHLGYQPVSAEDAADDFAAKPSHSTCTWSKNLFMFLLLEALHLLLLLVWLAWNSRGIVWQDELSQSCKLLPIH